ncbi:hypothetical protein ACFQRB_10915 [Halobaculum litoreum]|uniref:Uncharacterized protein n=1 Tax=Halobaculum litoreum TaxID=3031998 RepID=A0ABD5XTN2_9EURY
MTAGKTGDRGAAGAGATVDGGPERLLVVSGDDEWARRVATASRVPVRRLPPADAVAPETALDGYPAAVVVDGETPSEPVVPFAAVRDRYPDAACLLAGGGGRVDCDADGAGGDRPIASSTCPSGRRAPSPPPRSSRSSDAPTAATPSRSARTPASPPSTPSTGGGSSKRGRSTTSRRR